MILKLKGCTEKFREHAKDIETPDIFTSIGHYAFEDCESLAIHAPSVSYAEHYAKENRIRFVAE